MKNITAEANAYNSMPSTSDFASAKLQESFNFLGAKFSSGLYTLNLKKELLKTESQLNSVLAKEIGQIVISEIQNKQNIHIPYEKVRAVNELSEKLEMLKAQSGGN